jgi:hypothetical protein
VLSIFHVCRRVVKFKLRPKSFKVRSNNVRSKSKVRRETKVTWLRRSHSPEPKKLLNFSIDDLPTFDFESGLVLWNHLLTT